MDINSTTRNEHSMYALIFLPLKLFKSKNQLRSRVQFANADRLFDIRLGRWFPAVL